MATQNKIGELYVDITGRDRGASATIDRVKGKAEQATPAFKRMGDAAAGVQSAVSKILMPAALIGSITGAIALFVRLKDKVTEVGKEMDRVFSSSEDLLKSQVRASREFTDQQRTQLELADQFTAKQEELSEQTERATGYFATVGAQLARWNPLYRDVVLSSETVNELLIVQGNRLQDVATETQNVLRLSQERFNREEAIAQTLAAQEKFLQQRVSDLKQESQWMEEVRKAQEDAYNKEREAHKQRMRDLEEYNRAIRDSLAGGLFGGGAVAGGDVGAVVSALGQIADKLGGAR